MALSKKWTDWAVKLHTKTAQSGAAVHVDDIQSVDLSPELMTRVSRGDGNYYNSHGALVNGKCNFQFTTGDLKALLDECGVTGMLIDSDTNPGVVLYFQKMTQGATRDALNAGTHISTTFGDGLLYPVSLTMPDREDAILTTRGDAISSDGSTAPYAFSETASLTAATYPATAVRHCLGKVVLNATTISGLKSVDVQFGINVALDKGDSDVWDTHVCIASIEPVITFSGLHVDDTATLTEAGAYYTAEQIVFYAKKRDEGGTLVADGTAEHIKFTLGKSRVDLVSIGQDPKRLNARITPWATLGGSAVAPIAINTASAIT